MANKSKEEKEQEQQQEELRQQQAAQNNQANAGIPPNINETPIQTVPNVSATQAQIDAQAQATIQQNVDGDKQAHIDNENMRLLKRLVGKASPIVENKEEIEEGVDAEGNKTQTPVTKKVTTGYTYYHVDGKPFADWVQETFGGKITVDEKNNRIIYNDQK